MDEMRLIIDLLFLLFFLISLNPFAPSPSPTLFHRHSQMNSRLFEAFESRAQQVKEFMAGCGQKYGMACTCGPGCRCANCSEHCKQNRDAPGQNGQHLQQPNTNGMGGFPQDPYSGLMGGGGGPPPQIATGNSNMHGNNMNPYGNDPMGGMNGYGPNGGMGGNGMDQNGRLSPLGGGAEDGLGMQPAARPRRMCGC